MASQWIGLRELRAAIRRNPQMVLNEARRFLTHALAAYKRGIIREPWRVGGVGGGAPVRTGNLRDTHITKVNSLSASIGPNTRAAPYARYVHEGTRRMRKRPWLEYVKRTKAAEVDDLQRGMLRNVVRDLAR